MQTRRQFIATLSGAAAAPLFFKKAQAQKVAQFNVRSYGAVGDGTTSDDVAFGAAYAAAVAAGGGIIYLPAGTYKLTGALNLTDAGITVQGASESTAIIRGTAGVSTVAITAERCGLSDLTIEGPTSGAGTVSLYLYGITGGVTLDRVTVKNGVTASIFCDRCTGGIQASALTVQDSANIGLWLIRGIRGCAITTLTASGCAGAGLMLDAGTTSDSAAAVVRDNVFGTVALTNCASDASAGAALLFSGAAYNEFTTVTVTTTGASNPGIAFQQDQNAVTVGKTRYNVIHTATLSSISGTGVYFGGAVACLLGSVTLTTLNTANNATGYATHFVTGQGGGTDKTCTDNRVALLRVSQSGGTAYTHMAYFETADSSLTGRNSVGYASSGNPTTALAGYAGTNAPHVGADANTVSSDAPLAKVAAASGSAARTLAVAAAARTATAAESGSAVATLPARAGASIRTLLPGSGTSDRRGNGP